MQEIPLNTTLNPISIGKLYIKQLGFKLAPPLNSSD